MEQNVVFHHKAYVGAVDAVVVVAVGAADVVRIVERLAEVAAQEVFVAQFGSNGCSSENPVKITIEVDAEDVGAVIIEGLGVWGVAEEFEAVFRVIPVY